MTVRAGAAVAVCVAGPALAQSRAASPTTAPVRAATPASAPAASPERTDRAELDRTPIIGNRELPKVLYIVPWKKPLPGDLSGRPPVSVLDEALAPVDRDVFRREIRYDAQATALTSRPLPQAGEGAKSK